MIWVDNFSKTLARSIPTLTRDVYSSMLWTGMAVFSSSQTNLFDCTIKMDDTHHVVSAMPPNLCDYRNSVTEGLRFVHLQGRSYYPHSLVHQFGVNNVPMRIMCEDDVARNQHSGEDHSMGLLHPYQIIDKNIGSNIGLVSILRHDFYESMGMGTDECSRYVCLNVDENIFWRSLKVMLTPLLSSVLFGCTFDVNAARAGHVRPFWSRCAVAKVHGSISGLVAQLQMGNKKDNAGFWEGYHSSNVSPPVSRQRIRP